MWKREGFRNISLKIYTANVINICPTMANKWLLLVLPCLQHVFKFSTIWVENLTFSLVKVLRSIGQNAGGFLERKLNKLLRVPALYFITERCFAYYLPQNWLKARLAESMPTVSRLYGIAESELANGAQIICRYRTDKICIITSHLRSV